MFPFKLKNMLKIIVLVFALLFVNAWTYVIQPPISTHMLGGEEASPGQFPFIVAIKYRYQYPSGYIIYAHFCVGSILSEHWIVTSAGCLKRQRPHSFYIVTGLHYIQNDGVKHKVDAILLHPEFRGIDSYYVHDIALVRTSDPIEFSENVQPIGISTMDTNGTDGVPVQVTGWNLERSPIVSKKQFANDGNFNLKFYQGGLTYFNSTTIRTEDCRGYVEDRFQPFIHNTTVCTDNVNGTGICFGDEGNSLLNVIDGKLLGLSTWPIHCGNGRPDAFTRISAYLEWIEELTGINFNYRLANYKCLKRFPFSYKL